MAATGSYIPASDEGFRTWGETFATNISADPGKFLMTPAQAASVQAAVDDFVAKLAISSNEATRTRATIIEKDDARSIAETLCRQYAILIKDAPGVADSDKVTIGVRPINPDRNPVECPQTSPILSIILATPGVQEIRYSDSTTPDSRAKPFGASELQLFVAITADGQGSLDDAKFLGKFTKNPVQVNFTAEEDGANATYYARWASMRGETGPWSLPVTMRIVAPAVGVAQPVVEGDSESGPTLNLSGGDGLAEAA